MKDIAEKLKSAREATGISIEEAAEDLNYKVSQLEEIEIGNYKNFKDKFLLKTLITDYAKYLGLDGEELLDDFNEVLFEQTSKISVEDINTAIKEKEEREKDLKILSPYTTKKKKKGNIYIIIAIIVLILILVLVGYILLRNK